MNAPVIGVMRKSMGRALGAGTSGNPLQITSVAQLTEISVLVNAGKLESTVHGGSSTEKVYLKLMNDITLTGEWSPIGHEDSGYLYFYGHFDGNHKTIRGLYISGSTTYDNTGLFGMIKSGSVKDLRLVDVNITNSSYTGGVAGYVDDSSITNCYVTGTVNGGDYVGGVAGQLSDASTTNCYSTAAVSGISFVGGVAGAVYSGSVTNCYATGTVSGNAYIGGVVGYVESVNVADCAALNPSVKATGFCVGRVVGLAGVGTPLSNNVAFDGMTNGGGAAFDGADALDDLGGLDLAAADANGDIGGRFTIASGWTTAAGKLPGLFGETV